MHHESVYAILLLKSNAYPGGKSSMHMKSFSILLLAITLTITLVACGQKKTALPASPTPSTKVTSSPSASIPPTVTRKSYTAPPAMTIDKNKLYSALFDTNLGKFTVQLYAKEASKTVNNFVFLANERFYEGVVFHRIIKSFMIQTGDPLGNGTGGPGYKFEDELNTGFKYEPGIVAMANSGKNTNGSQFFICTGEDSKSLNMQPNYSIFGKVSDGMDVVQKIAATPVKIGSEASPSLPTEKVIINSITIFVK